MPGICRITFGLTPTACGQRRIRGLSEGGDDFTPIIHGQELIVGEPHRAVAATLFDDAPLYPSAPGATEEFFYRVAAHEM
jgi:hypothetical protein